MNEVVNDDVELLFSYNEYELKGLIDLYSKKLLEPEIMSTDMEEIIEAIEYTMNSSSYISDIEHNISIWDIVEYLGYMSHININYRLKHNSEKIDKLIEKTNTGSDNG